MPVEAAEFVAPAASSPSAVDSHDTVEGDTISTPSTINSAEDSLEPFGVTSTVTPAGIEIY